MQFFKESFSAIIITTIDDDDDYLIMIMIVSKLRVISIKHLILSLLSMISSIGGLFS